MNVEMQPEVKLSPLRLIIRFVSLALCSKRGPIVKRMRVDQAFFLSVDSFAFGVHSPVWQDAGPNSIHERAFYPDENWNSPCTLEIPVKDAESYWVTVDLLMLVLTSNSLTLSPDGCRNLSLVSDLSSTAQ